MSANYRNCFIQMSSGEQSVSFAKLSNNDSDFENKCPTKILNHEEVQRINISIELDKKFTPSFAFKYLASGSEFSTNSENSTKLLSDYFYYPMTTNRFKVDFYFTVKYPYFENCSNKDNKEVESGKLWQYCNSKIFPSLRKSFKKYAYSYGEVDFYQLIPSISSIKYVNKSSKWLNTLLVIVIQIKFEIQYSSILCAETSYDFFTNEEFISRVVGFESTIINSMFLCSNYFLNSYFLFCKSNEDFKFLVDKVNVLEVVQCNNELLVFKLENERHLKYLEKIIENKNIFFFNYSKFCNNLSKQIVLRIYSWNKNKKSIKCPNFTLSYFNKNLSQIYSNNSINNNKIFLPKISNIFFPPKSHINNIADLVVDLKATDQLKFENQIMHSTLLEDKDLGCNLDEINLKSDSSNNSENTHNESDELLSNDSVNNLDNQEFTGLKVIKLNKSEREPFIIDKNNINNDKDKRTTVMIKNIPKQLKQSDLISLFAAYYDLYDFLYLPVDFKTMLNAGFAFINFKSPKYIPNFFEEYNLKDINWNSVSSSNSIKSPQPLISTCYISYARIQGFNYIVEHFKNSKISSQTNVQIKPLIKFC